MASPIKYTVPEIHSMRRIASVESSIYKGLVQQDSDVVATITEDTDPFKIRNIVQSAIEPQDQEYRNLTSSIFGFGFQFSRSS